MKNPSMHESHSVIRKPSERRYPRIPFIPFIPFGKGEIRG